jgi:cobalt-zinc-cadmium efflux system outer membrane protein
MNGKICLILSIFIIAGCTSQSPDEHTSYDISNISEGIEQRTDYTLMEASEPNQFDIPDQVILDDGLSQDEAVALALWNNAQFRTDLTALGFARAELLEANMLKNPVFSILFPVSPKLLETALDIPIDVLWQRPHRIAAAELDAQRLSENLIENGLGLIRDVQLTYGDLVLAQERIILANEKAQIQVQISKLDQARLRTGEISELTASTSYVDTLRSSDAVKRFSKKADTLKHKLNSLLGITSGDVIYEVVPSEIAPISKLSIDDILKTAFACRPDLRAAELGIEAAGKRIGWEKSKVYNFIAVLDGDDTDDDSFTIRPGFDVEVPVFNRNDAKIARAEAELKQAAQRYEAIRQNINLQVQQAYTQYTSAHEQFELWDSEIIPTLEQSVEQAKNSYESGKVSLLLVLQAQIQLIEARMHLTELIALLNSSKAELNFCVGKKMI